MQRGGPGTPDAMGVQFYGSVIQDGGRYRMWYVAWDDEAKSKSPSARWRAAYAESTDGVTWVKPELGLVEFRGSRENNLVDMGGAWGVNRSVSQIHALLYLSSKPLTAEEIADTLGIARSNVSNSLKELLSWNLIRRVPIRADRRDHYEAETDIWEIVGRKAREIDPVLAVLKSCAEQAANDKNVTLEARARLAEMLEFTTSIDRWFQQMLAVPRGTLKTILKLGSKIASFIPGKK